MAINQLKPDASRLRQYAWLAMATLTLPGTLQAQEQLTTATAGASQFPTISGDGSRVSFQSTADLDGGNGDGSNDIFIIDADGGEPIQLTATTQGAIRPSIRGDGSQILFLSSADPTGENTDGSVELFVTDGSGDSVDQLTETTGSPGIQQARLSRDGNRIVFVAGGNLGGGNPDGSLEIFSLAATGGDPVQLSDGPGGSSSQFPAISPDGSLVVFSSNANPDGANGDGNTELFIVNAAGGDTPRQLTDTVTGQSLRPSIAASGRVIFESTANPTGENADGNNELFVIEADGSGLTQLTDSSGGATAFPRIAADSSLAVFQSNIDFAGDNPDGSLEIFLIDTDSGGITQLTDSGVVSEQADISADGGRVVYQSAGDPDGDNPEGNVEIFVVSTGGSGSGSNGGSGGNNGDGDDVAERRDDFPCFFVQSGCSYCEEDARESGNNSTNSDSSSDTDMDSDADGNSGNDIDSGTTARIDPTLSLLAGVGLLGVIRRRRRRR